MSDPFGDPMPSPTPQPSRSTREPFVRQAVSFLSDTRVQTAEPSKALDFLRQKGVTDDELREAYRRVGIPFPSAISADAPLLQPPTALTFPPANYPPHAAPYPFPTTQLANYPPPPQRSSWFNVFLGLTAAAGLYTAVREVLKRYIVPMYFPDAARIAEERRRREDQASEIQGRQIAELRTCVQELLESSLKTNEKVDQMSQSMSSTVALRERELSQTSELRDAIRQLSHSVTVSAGTETSREIRSHLGQAQIEGSNAGTAGVYGHKLGSLAYSHVDHFEGLTSKGEEGEVYSTPPGKREMSGGGQEIEKSSDNVYLGKSVAKIVNTFENNGETEEDNDFMGIAPAEVDASWVAGNAGKDKESDEREEEKVSEVVVSGEVGDTEEVEKVEEDEGSKMMARQLFQNAIMKEAQQVLSHSSNSGSSSQQRARPLSMPPMDLPLSDSEY